MVSLCSIFFKKAVFLNLSHYGLLFNFSHIAKASTSHCFAGCVLGSSLRWAFDCIFVKTKNCPKDELAFGFRPLSENQKKKKTSASSASRAKRV